MPKIIVELSEEDYNFIKEIDESNYEVTTNLYQAVQNGTPLTECNAEDCISRENLQITLYEKCNGNPNYRINYHNLKSLIKNMPYVYPKSEPLTLEKAIDYLHEIGWMQEHDKAMTETSWDNSVLENIKADIKNIGYKELDNDIVVSAIVSVDDVIDIIDRHISGKENHD